MSTEPLQKWLGDDYKFELADVDAAAGVCAEILAVLRQSVMAIETRIHHRHAYRTDTYETELIAAARARTTPKA